MIIGPSHDGSTGCMHTGAGGWERGRELLPPEEAHTGLLRPVLMPPEWSSGWSAAAPLMEAHCQVRVGPPGRGVCRPTTWPRGGYQDGGEDLAESSQHSFTGV